MTRRQTGIQSRRETLPRKGSWKRNHNNGECQPFFQTLAAKNNIASKRLSSRSLSLSFFIFYIYIFFYKALDTKTTQLNQKQISLFVLHLIFHRLTVVLVSFCSLIGGITPTVFCFVLITLVNSVLLKLLCVWIWRITKIAFEH